MVPPLEAKSTEYVSCCVCKDAKPIGPDMIRVSECRHIYCRGCIPALVRGQINDLPDMVKCVGSTGCDNTFSFQELSSFVPEEVMERWKAAKAESSVLCWPLYLQCPFLKCGKKSVDDERGFLIRACPYCHGVFCINCGVKWHWGKSCQRFQEELKEEFGGDEELV